MRKLFASLLLLPLFVVGQNSSVISVSRYFPKAEKMSLFEKAIGTHAQKYHKGDVQWRVFTIDTGPDAGGYHVVEGPKTWDSEDKRGDMGKAHMDDWAASVQPLLTDRTSTSYLTFRGDLSSVEMTDYADKIAVERLFFKPGYYMEMQESITNMKKVWVDGKQSVAVYEASSSGEPQFAIVTRYKQGLKEREVGFREPLNIRYTKAHGQDGWNKWVAGRKEMVSHMWSEMLTYKPELGSK